MDERTAKYQRALLFGIPFDCPLDMPIDEAIKIAESENEEEKVAPRFDSPPLPLFDYKHPLTEGKAEAVYLDTDEIQIARFETDKLQTSHGPVYGPVTTIKPQDNMPQQKEATFIDTGNLTIDGKGIYAENTFIDEDAVHEGKRFNSGKNRLDLIPAFVREQLGRVLTKGAEKYDERNWEKGMAWSNPVASLERHLNAFKGGEDYDPESGELHVAHIMANAMFLTQYYKTYPQGDDRPQDYLETPKIGLDIDEVLCNWLGAWRERFDIEKTPKSWFFTYDLMEQFDELKENGEFEDFFLNLEPLVDPEDIPFQPHCYITSRSVPQWITEQWLEVNGFPTRPVYTVGHGKSKVEVAQEAGIDWFVDDAFKNFKELNNANICTFLMDRPHNRKYDVGHKRIHSLRDLFNPLDRNKV